MMSNVYKSLSANYIVFYEFGAPLRISMVYYQDCVPTILQVVTHIISKIVI